jgi:antitoxin component YwqK of YwqJK toxin-antitoxin module
MKLPYTLFLLLITKLSFGCSCAPMADFKSKDDLKEYDFIALMTVKELAPIDTSSKFMRLRKNGDIKINLTELFKGNSVDQVYDSSFRNDCAFDLQVGEQWIFFGTTYNGKINISRCGYSVKYRDTIGAREWWYFGGIKQLDVLRTIYAHQQESNAFKKQFYLNGNIEVEQKFKNGKLNGLRRIYYPNGKIHIEEKFKDGNRVDFRNTYHPSGQLIESVTYSRGFIKQVVQYQDTTEVAWYMNFQTAHNNDLLFGDKDHDPQFFISTLDSLRKLKAWDKQIASSRKYADNGRSYDFVSFNYRGVIRAKGYLDWDKQINEHTNYYDNGKVQMYIKYDQINDQQIEYDYTKEGKRRDFVRKCESCKYYFSSSSEPEATPQKTYIQ